MRYIVTKDHRPELGEPLQVAAGDVLEFERRETEYAGWIWCTDAQGRQGWVPERWVTIDGSHCRMKRDYSALELTVADGETVEVLEIESDWAWVRDSKRRTGWVPLGSLRRG